MAPRAGCARAGGRQGIVLGHIVHGPIVQGRSVPPRGAVSPVVRDRPTLSRRPATFLAAGGLLVVLIAVSALLPAPYVVEGPGPTEDTLGSYRGVPVLRISHRTYPTDGELRLTTVVYTSANRRLDVWSALRGWLDPQRAVVPRQLVYPEGTTQRQQDEENAQLMSRSQESAKVAALRRAGFAVPEVVVVEAVQKGAPALGRLEAGDQLLAVDGKAVRTPAAVGSAVRSHAPGEQVVFEVRRDGRRRTVRVPTQSREVAGSRRTVVGITPAIGYDFPFDVEVTLGENIGGPSAGLLFALGIYDKLTPGPLADGRVLAGTGEIDSNGRVGVIGGIQQKVIAARDSGASVFLAPADNCRDLGAGDHGIQIVTVRTLDDAVHALDELAAGRTDLPSCG